MDAQKIKELNKKITEEQISKNKLFELETLIKNELEETENKRLEKLGKRVRHALYECRDCADAKFKYKYDGGEEKELFISDCGKDTCPYAEYFKGQDKTSEIDLILKKMLLE